MSTEENPCYHKHILHKTSTECICAVTSSLLFQVLKIGDEGHNAIQEHGKSNWWLPLKWSVNIVKTAMMEERAANAPSYAALVKSISVFRANLTAVLTYGHVTVPLVYTQVRLLKTLFRWC